MRATIIQEWVIWAKTTEGMVFHSVKNCKEPNRTKYYRDIQKRFSSKCDIHKYGYITLKEVKSKDGWINYDTKIEI